MTSVFFQDRMADRTWSRLGAVGQGAIYIMTKGRLEKYHQGGEIKDQPQ